MRTFYEPRTINPKELEVIGRFEGFRERAHPNLPIYDFDVVVGFGGGLLVGERENEPAKGKYWIMGGRKFKGEPPKDSVLRLVEGETGLTLRDPIVFLHHCNEVFSADNIGHGKGTETPSVIYFAEGKGTLNLDYQHSGSKIIVLPGSDMERLQTELGDQSGMSYQEYSPEFAEALPDSVRRSMDLAFPLTMAPRGLLEEKVRTGELITIDGELSMARFYKENPDFLKNLPQHLVEELR